MRRRIGRFCIAALPLVCGCESASDPIGEYPVPRVTEVNPDLIEVGSSSATLLIVGEGLNPTSVVRLDGQDLETTYVNVAEVRAEVPENLLASVATYGLTIFNPPPGGGESEPLQLHVGILPAVAAPRIRSFDPWTATAGDAGFTLRVRGGPFTPASRVRWNGAEQATTYVHSGELSIEVSASQVASPGAGRVTVSDPELGESFVGGFPVLTGGSPSFSVQVVPLSFYDIVTDPTRDVIYGTESYQVIALDPFSGEILWSVPTGVTPSLLAVSDDGAYLYVALAGAARLMRLSLPSGMLDMHIQLGNEDQQDFRAQDLVAIPGRPGSVAVARITALGGSPSHRGVAVYDDGMMRPGPTGYANHIEPSAWSSRLYGYDNTTTSPRFHRLTLRPSGVVVDASSSTVTTGRYPDDIVFDQGLMFTVRGDVFDPEALTVLGNIRGSGALLPDVANGRVHWLDGGTLTTFHYSAFVQLGGLDVPEAQGSTVLARFGSDGIAMGGGQNVILVRSDLIGS